MVTHGAMSVISVLEPEPAVEGFVSVVSTVKYRTSVLSASNTMSEDVLVVHLKVTWFQPLPGDHVDSRF